MSASPCCKARLRSLVLRGVLRRSAIPFHPPCLPPGVEEMAWFSSRVEKGFLAAPLPP